jgi:uncharacterized protein YndB with AHSA1/START domain
MSTTTDQIRKQVLLRAPRQRVWDALTDAKKFGTWFGAEFDAGFVAGKRVQGRVVPTKVDEEAAKEQQPYSGMAFDLLVERIEPMERFSFRWHPGEPGADDADPMTLVTFELREAQGGILLTITESGFDQLPLERRARAFELNEGGWEGQTKLIEKYLRHAA